MYTPCGRGQLPASSQPHSTSLLDVTGWRGALTVERPVKLAEGVIKEWLGAKWLEWRLKGGRGALWREQRGYRDGGTNQTGIWPLEQRANPRDASSGTGSLKNK